ncbi:hypothetical protein [Flavobacterium lacisediminis]|uniref:Carboxypeptidase regulatory-like domain-containing protein n=1 Tax=Flavobacterium lacisediminis TaxID=2989705 RepID=A0ABT3EEH5_9FLAO|nr:hypothetical protein [Flavobacterium lacisediminis]MCW1146978.1 hypothetical protein [Flavobacterium lacisediminis]
MKKLLLIIAVAPLLLATQCNEDDNGIACTEEARAGLNITIKDAETNAYLNEGVSVVATDGSYSETLESFDSAEPVFSGAYERQGNYTITVSKTGYVTYISEVISVTSDVCHVIPQQRTILLQPE